MPSDVSFVGDGRGGVTVMRDGQPQSHVDLRDPENLAFEYVQQMAAVIATLPPGPLAVTHVGGAGLSLARWVNHTRPGSPQIVLEPDADLTDAVRRELPRRHRIRVRPVDGLSGIRALRDSSADVVAVDAFVGGRVPAELTTLEFYSDVCRVLASDGTALLNVGDEPGLRFVARVVAGAFEVLGHVALVATQDVLKGKRFGNIVVVASSAGIDVDEIRRIVARSPFPTGVRAEAEVRRLAGHARPFTLADSAASPPPPPLKGWRLR